MYDYDDLFREAADALRKARHLEQALRFYWPLQRVAALPRASYYFLMAECHLQLRSFKAVEDCYNAVLEEDGENVRARVALARLYMEMGMAEKVQVVGTTVTARSTLAKR